MRVHKSTVSRGVATLERLGLIERVQHPADGRAQLLSVPPAARAQLDAFRGRNYSWFGQLLADWTEDDVQAFAGQLAKLNRAAEQTPR
jgi:DNA-binding MarR family transcriptional regulator